MENIIRKVIESEYRAQQIVREGVESRKLALIEAEKEISRISKEINDSLRNKIDKIKAEKKREAGQESEKIIMEARNKVFALKNEFSRRKDMLVKEIFSDIIRGSN